MDKEILNGAIEFAEQFDKDAQRTFNPGYKLVNPDRNHAVLGLDEELTEIRTDKFKAEEVGDVLWFAVLFCHSMGISFKNVATKAGLFLPREIRRTVLESNFSEFAEKLRDEFLKSGAKQEDIEAMVGHSLRLSQYEGMRGIADFFKSMEKAENAYSRELHQSYEDKISGKDRKECSSFSFKTLGEDNITVFLTLLRNYCTILEIDPDDACKRVIAKLKVRYPEKFSNKDANNRDLDAEGKNFQ